MQISTLQKIQSKLFNVLLLPITVLVCLLVFFIPSFWQNHFLLATLIFTLSLTASLYFAAVNIIEKPLHFLIKIYNDNKKYKTIHKLIPESQSKELTANKQSENQSENFKAVLKPQMLRTNAQRLRTNTSRHSKSISFISDSDKYIQEHKFPPVVPQPISRQKSRKSTKTSPQNGAGFSQIQTQNQGLKTNLNDISNMFAFKNQKVQLQIPQRKAMPPKKQDGHQFDEYDEQEQSDNLRNHLKQIFGLESTIEQELRDNYEKRYSDYKTSLKFFSLDKESMAKFISQTKSVLREKIIQHLKKQFENLDSIQSLLKMNFQVNFNSYRDKSTSLGHTNLYGFGPTKTYGKPQQQRNLNIKQGFKSQNTVQQMNFSQALQECVNLLHTNYFDFEYTGQASRIDQVKNQLKILIKERIQLDKFLSLRKSLDIGRNQSQKKQQSQKTICEFGDQRYVKILKLQTLANILSQRESAQQNMLKQFFSKHSHSAQNTEQINDSKNIEILINFYVRIVRQKLSDCGNEDLIKVKLSRPNFQDSSVNMIWVKKQNNQKSHYDIVYSLRDKADDMNKETEKRGIPNPEMTLNCCPGDTNIWTCISLLRLLISRIGLRKEKFSMIKDNKLRKEFTRMVELVK